MASRGSEALKVVEQERDEHPQYADPDEVASFAAGLKVTWLYCRELGHNWIPHTGGRRRKQDGGGYVRTLRCTRCKTLRHQELSAGGMIEKSSYEHPEGYLASGMGRIVGEGRGILRLESLKRLTSKE